jgi:toxin ParE1/3/4
MASYKLSNLASEDLARIYEYGILNFGLTQAQDYLLGLHERFQKLADNELPVRDASQFATNLKRSQYQRDIIFYQPQGESTLIVRVLGKNMDFVRHLDSDE